MMRRLPLFLFFISIGSFSFGQNELDLFRYSKSTYQGSARFEGMGGAFGALGADLSSAQINPAGYGRYSTSQFGLSVYGGGISNHSTFASTPTHSATGIGGLSNLSLVLTNDISERNRGFLYSQIGLGFNRIENFKNSFSYQGKQFPSLLDDFTSRASGYSVSELNTFFPFSTALAYKTGAIVLKPGTTNEYQSLLNSGDEIHKRSVNNKGGMNEFFFSYSANYLNRLYLGGNIGLRTYNYEDSYTHSEVLTETTGTSLRSFDYSYTLDIKGSGINVKLGAIYLFSEALRVGLAFHSPSWSQLTENYTANMVSRYDTYTSTITPTDVPTGSNKYRIRNPSKLVGSIAYVFGTRGCIDVDVEYVNYQRAYFSATTDNNYPYYDYAAENNFAKQVFQRAINVRVGGELVLFSRFFLRLGFSYYGNAFRSEQLVELTPDVSYSGGFGYKNGKYSFDISYKNRTSSQNYYSFSQGVTQVDTNKGIATMSFLITF